MCGGRGWDTGESWGLFVYLGSCSSVYTWAAWVWCDSWAIAVLDEMSAVFGRRAPRWNTPLPPLWPTGALQAWELCGFCLVFYILAACLTVMGH
jgi:hypothetical protein